MNNAQNEEKSGGEWIEHDGRDRPVPPQTIVEVRLRNGEVIKPVLAELWGRGEEDCSNWNHKYFSEYSIVAYRVVFRQRLLRRRGMFRSDRPLRKRGALTRE